MFRVFPAPAGINRRANTSGAINPRVPRASGDKPKQAGDQFNTLMCSPRQRG